MSYCIEAIYGILFLGVYRQERQEWMKPLYSLTRIKKVSRWLYLLFQVMFYLYGALILATFCLGAIKLLFPNAFDSLTTSGWYSLFGVVITAIPNLCILKTVSRILKDTSLGKTLFSMKQVTRVRMVALFMLVGAVLTTLVSPGFINAVSLGSLHMGASPDPETVNSIIPISFSTLFLALVFFCLSLAFEYGILLQQESDDIV